MHSIHSNSSVLADVTPAVEPSSRILPNSLVVILSILRRRKFTILACIVAALVLGLIATLLMKPEYTASTSIEVKREDQNIANVKGGDAMERGVIDPEFYETQYGLLKSRALAESVARDLGLNNQAGFFDEFGSRKAKTWFFDGRLKPGASSVDERAEEAGSLLLRNLSVESQRLSRLVTIKFTSPDRMLSMRVANAWSKHFIQATLERRFETTSYARKFLEDRLGQLRARIDQSERQLVSYAADQGIVNLPASGGSDSSGTASSGERSLLVEDLVALNRQLAQATADRIQAESRLNGLGGQTQEALNNQALSTIRATRADLAAQYAKMLEQFEPSYPAARALKAQIGSLDSQLAGQEGQIHATLQETYRASADREKLLDTRINSLKNSLFDLRRRSVQYSIIQREVDTNRQLYDALLQRYKEIGVAGGVGANNISVVDSAQLPEKPSSPRLFLNLFVALLTGSAGGLGLALILEQLDDAISDPSEIMSQLRLPLLGIIPVAEADPMQELLDPKSSLTEAYFSLETNLSFATDHGFPRTLTVTSSRAAEGKSLTSCALAGIVARSGRRVMLIDADMRSPSIHRNFDLQGDRGLSNILAGADDLTSYVQKTDIENLSVIAAGPLPPSSAQLLSSNRLEKLLDELLRTYDNVIVDAPPVMGLADALLVGSRAERVIFVIEAHATGKSVARVATQRLQGAGVNLLGAVVTKFSSKRSPLSYGYDYGYGYSYGDSSSGRA